MLYVVLMGFKASICHQKSESLALLKIGQLVPYSVYLGSAYAFFADTHARRKDVDPLATLSDQGNVLEDDCVFCQTTLLKTL